MSPELRPPENSIQTVHSQASAAPDSSVAPISSWKVKSAVASALLLATFVWWNASARRSEPTPVEFGAGEIPVVAPAPAKTSVLRESSALPQTTASTALPTIKVHVAGLVKKPGVYDLPAGARIADAVQRAGGAQKDGDINAINLAAWAEDGARIEVPPKAAPAAETPEAMPTRSFRSRVPLRRKPSAPRIAATPEVQSKSTVTAEAKFPIDINRADALTLEALPGVGPETAQKILDYRKENGSFKSVDDLDEVNGIGPIKLEKMRAFVVVR